MPARAAPENPGGSRRPHDAHDKVVAVLMDSCRALAVAFERRRSLTREGAAASTRSGGVTPFGRPPKNDAAGLKTAQIRANAAVPFPARAATHRFRGRAGFTFSFALVAADIASQRAPPNQRALWFGLAGGTDLVESQRADRRPNEATAEGEPGSTQLTLTRPKN